MTEIARLHFRSAKNPVEGGALVLRDDGTIQVAPGVEYRDALAEREAQALAVTEAVGTRLGLGLLALGAVAVAAGWYLGRALGSLARNLSAPRAVGDVTLARDSSGALRLRMPGAEHRWLSVTQEWPAGDHDAAEADRFLKAWLEARQK